MSSEENFPTVLHGRLWHTTNPDRYQMILDSGFIMPNPPISDRERWKTGQGPELYPYVRLLDGVSLFDFEGFDPETYIEMYPLSSWREFVPYMRIWGQSVWIEIDRQIIKEDLISGENLLAKWKHEGAYRHTIMPIIEAAHLGPIPVEAFKRVFKCGDDTLGFEKMIT
jgi:hypothetical protein